MAAGYILQINGLKILTSEALYQALRFPHLPQIQKQIIECKSPMGAKMLAKKYKSQTRTDWQDIKVEIMNLCLLLKTKQNFSQMKILFNEAGNLPIVEESKKDRFWGAVLDNTSSMLRGCNVLGKLLTEVRMLILNAPLPDDIELKAQVNDLVLCERKIL